MSVNYNLNVRSRATLAPVGDNLGTTTELRDSSAPRSQLGYYVRKDDSARYSQVRYFVSNRGTAALLGATLGTTYGTNARSRATLAPVGDNFGTTKEQQDSNAPRSLLGFYVRKGDSTRYSQVRYFVSSRGTAAQLGATLCTTYGTTAAPVVAILGTTTSNA